MEVSYSKFIILMMFLGFTQCKSINWNIHLQNNSKQGIKLINSFSSLEKRKIIIDRKAFSYTCYYGEDIKLEKDKIPDFSELEYNQIIIENKDGAKRLFSNVFFEEGEIKELPDENCMFDWFEYLSLNQLPQKVVIDISYLSDLKVKEQDKEVRLIYLFKATEEQKRNGYMNLIIISNWMYLE